jgi:hypothetical protein
LFKIYGLDEAASRIMKEPEIVSTVIPKMLDASGKIVIAQQQATIASMGIGQSGDLKKSIGVYGDYKSALKPHIIVAPVGSRTVVRKRKGALSKRNAMIGAFVNYGTKRNGKTSMKKRPWMNTANKAAENAVHKVQEEIWNAYHDT